jgi:hypothetical protein
VIALHSPDGLVETGLPMCPPEKKGAKAYLRAAAGYFLQSGLREQFAKLAISSDFAAIGASFLCVPRLAGGARSLGSLPGR